MGENSFTGIEVSSTSLGIELLDSDTIAVVPLHQRLIEDQRAEVVFTGIRDATSTKIV